MIVVLPDAAVAALRAEPGVVLVAPDGVTKVATAPWGLDRIDQRSLPLDNVYTYFNDGTGVTVYIIDSGINFSHVDFGGRASLGYDVNGGTGADCLGHGTHVAGTVGGATYGVAKNVTLVAVRVFSNCSDSTLDANAVVGIDWVTAHKAASSVANVSLSAPNDSGGIAIDSAIARSIVAGVTYVVAAGNNADSACNYAYSSTSTRGAITVGATNITDGFASYFSNYGSCVTLNAPGVGITSDWIGSTTATRVDTGTSMSAPHAAGAAAIYLQIHPGSTPAQVKAGLLAQATSGVLSGVPSGTANLLLYTLPGMVLSTSISGPSHIGPGNTCNYSESTSGGTSPYTLAWSWTAFGGSAAGYSPSYGNFLLVDQSSATFTINLTVTATDVNGGQGTYTKSVAASSSNSHCF